MYLFRSFLDILFPRQCIVCNTAGALFCESCQKDTSKPYEQLSPWIHSLFRYKHPNTRKVVWSLKYRNSHAVARDIAPNMHDEIIEFLTENLVEEKSIVLVPIPMTRKKKRERGFNQSEILAKEIKHQNKDLFTCAKTLLKTKETEPQAKIKNKTKRLQNMRGVFTCRKEESIEGKVVVLVDDITTTGATLREARKILKQAGAKQVFAVTIGH